MIRGRSKYSKEVEDQVMKLKDTMSYSQIAKKLEIPPGTVGTIVFRKTHNYSRKANPDRDYWDGRCPITGWKLGKMDKDMTPKTNGIKLWR